MGIFQITCLPRTESTNQTVSMLQIQVGTLWRANHANTTSKKIQDEHRIFAKRNVTGKPQVSDGRASIQFSPALIQQSIIVKGTYPIRHIFLMTLIRVKHFFLTYGFASSTDGAAIGKHFNNVVAAYHHVGRIIASASHSPHDRIGAQLVIAVDEQHIFTCGGVQTGITGSRHSLTGLVNHTNTLVTLRGCITAFR